MDADKSEAAGLLLGAPVVVDYTGKLEDGATATKVATDPTYAEAVGRWTMPDPIDPEGVMGVKIQVEGAAQSINMATLVYTSWELQGEADKILLKGQSIGQRPDHRFHPDRRDREGRRGQIHPLDRGHRHGLHQSRRVIAPIPKIEVSGPPGTFFCSRRRRGAPEAHRAAGLTNRF